MSIEKNDPDARIRQLMAQIQALEEALERAREEYDSRRRLALLPVRGSLEALEREFVPRLGGLSQRIADLRAEATKAWRQKRSAEYFSASPEALLGPGDPADPQGAQT